MKRLILILSVVIVLAFTADKETEHFATVEKVADTPVFIFSRPVSEYETVGKALSFSEMLKLATDQKSNTREKTAKIVDYAIKRVENGKISDFDALIIELENDKVRAIKFKSAISQKAKIESYGDLPVYFFCNPDEEYEVVTQLEADYSARAAKGGMLFDKIRSMVKRTLKKRDNNEIEYFDAIIINPDDLSEKLIVYKGAENK